jgi:hypothetical protein
MTAVRLEFVAFRVWPGTIGNDGTTVGARAA